MIDTVVHLIGMTDRVVHLIGMIDRMVHQIGMIDTVVHQIGMTDSLVHHQTGMTESGGVVESSSGHDTTEVEEITRCISSGDTRDMEDTLPG